MSMSHLVRNLLHFGCDFLLQIVSNPPQAPLQDLKSYFARVRVERIVMPTFL